MSLITDVAFVIPTHPPHFHYLYNLLNKLEKHHITIDIFLVFSNDNDYNTFELKEKIKPIIIREPLNYMSMITSKKFYGLKQLINTHYDYFIVCDSEIDIIPENFTKDNIKYKLDNIFKNKKIYAGDLNGRGIRYVNTYCASLYYGEDFNKLKEATKDFTLYSWWSDIPVYRRSDLKYFFEKVNCNNIHDRAFFDHIIYQYFLILTDNFKVIDTTPISNTNWSLESLYTSNEEILNKLSDELQYGFGWITKILYQLNKSYFISKNTFLIYHLDRDSCST